jgi:hypothetical protein
MERIGLVRLQRNRLAHPEQDIGPFGSADSPRDSEYCHLNAISLFLKTKECSGRNCDWIQAGVWGNMALCGVDSAWSASFFVVFFFPHSPPTPLAPPGERGA